MAGGGGYHVDADEVELKGGAIVSTADKKNNDLTTNKLTHSNIQNKMDYDVSSVSISANLSSPSVTPGLPTLEKGKDSNTTLATLSEGNITVGGKKTTTQELGINSDAAAGNKQLGKLPDLASKLEEKKIITQATSNIVATTKQISSDIATKAEKKQDEIKKEYQDQLPEQQQQAFNNLSAAEQDAQLAQKNPEYAKVKQDKQDWGIGGQKRQALDVVTGIVTGALGGQGIAQIATNAAAPYVANTISNTFGDNAKNPNKTAQIFSHAILGAVDAYNNGGSAVVGALSGSGSELAGDYLLKTLYPGKEKQDLNEQEKQQLKGITNSVAAVAGGLAGNSAANVAISTVVADNAVEHNLLLTPKVREKLSIEGKKLYDILSKDTKPIEYFEDKIKQCDSQSCRETVTKDFGAEREKMKNLINEKFVKGEISEEQRILYFKELPPKMMETIGENAKDLKRFGTFERMDWSPMGDHQVVVNDMAEIAFYNKQIAEGKTPEEAQEAVKSYNVKMAIGQAVISVATTATGAAAKKLQKQQIGDRRLPNPVPVKIKTTSGEQLKISSNTKHTLGCEGNSCKAGIEPRNSAKIAKNAVGFTGKDGKRTYYAQDKDGHIHRYNDTNDGTHHWSGSTADKNNPLKLDSDIEKVLKKQYDWTMPKIKYPKK